MSNQSASQHIKKTVKHSAVYAVGSILHRLTGFIMLPIYTRYLTPADYGTVELLTMAIEIVAILIGVRISQALFRYYIIADSKLEKDIIVSTVLITVIIGSSIGVAALYAASEPLSLAIFGHAAYSDELRLFSFTLLLNAVIAACQSYLRARQKPVLFVSINMVYLIIQVIFNIYFVVMLQLHVLGVIYSALASGAIMSVFLLLYTLSNVGIHYSFATAKKLIVFTIPLMVASVGALYVSYADRYFLRVFGSLADVGLYSLAFRLSAALAIVFEAFNLSWSAARFEIVKESNAREIYSRMFRYLSVLLFVSGGAVAIFAQDIFWLMTAPEFYAAGPIVPILTLAAIVRMFTLYNNFGILLKERTRHIAEAAWLKAIVASIAYISMIPLLGIYGAAIGMVIAHLVEFGWVYNRSQKLYDMGLEWRPVALMGATAAIGVLLAISLPSNDIRYFMMRVVLFFALIITMYKLPVWSAPERETIVNTMKKYFAIVSRTRT